MILNAKMLFLWFLFRYVFIDLSKRDKILKTPQTAKIVWNCIIKGSIQYIIGGVVIHFSEKKNGMVYSLAKLLYKYNCPSVRQFEREPEFSQLLIKIHDELFLYIPLIYEHLFYKYFVCWSGNKRKKCKTWKCDFLSPF